MIQVSALLLSLLALAAAAPIEDIKNVERRAVTAASPYSALGNSQIAIYLRWDIGDTAGADLDHVIRMPDGCIISAKDGSNQGYCGTVNGYGIMSLNSQLSSGTSTLDNPSDSTSTVASPGVKGAEVILLDHPDTGDHDHIVYQAGASTGYTLAASALVTVYKQSGLVSTYAVTGASKQNACYGRFWNTFKLSVSASSPVAFTLTSRQSITATPFASLGTTATQAFEGVLSRPSTGC